MSITAFQPFLPAMYAGENLYPARIIAFSGTTANTCAHATGITSRILGITPPATKFATGSTEDASGYAFQTGDPVGYYGLPFTRCKVQLGGSVPNLLTPLTATAAGKAVAFVPTTGTAGTLNWQVGYNLESGSSDELVDVWLDIRYTVAFAS